MKKDILKAVCGFGVRLLFPLTSNVVRLVTDIKVVQLTNKIEKENMKTENGEC